MKPLIYSDDTPNNLDTDFNIDWSHLIISGTPIEKENGITYLEEIKKYCNEGGIPEGIVGKYFHYKSDTEFEKLLAMIHGLPLQEHFINSLFIKTDIKKHLQEFSTDPDKLNEQLAAAKFQYLNSFKIEGELSNFLYNYGIYDHFYDVNTASKAVEVTKSFTKLLYQSDVDNVICFFTRLPWGDWFDEYSCSDYSIVVINKKDRVVWLFCFSHSD